MANPRSYTEVGQYYDQQVNYARAVGAGLVWFMAQDHLSPSLSNEDMYALDSTKWRESISSRVISMAREADIKEGDTVLDLGCGIGGAGRDITQQLGANVVGLSISFEQLRNCLILPKINHSKFRSLVKSDMAVLPFKDSVFDKVYAVNSIYHVNKPEEVAKEAFRVLQPGGYYAIDDWFLESSATLQQVETLRHNWSTGNNGFHNFSNFIINLYEAGFDNLKVIDYTQSAGEFLCDSRFGNTYDEQVAPKIIEAFPLLYEYDGYKDEHAHKAVTQLRDNVLFMGELYRNGAASYKQIIAFKS